jgi:pimeloyl-ACP methyl ester carboxylesterase
VIRFILRALAGLFALALLVFFAALGYRAWRQQENAQALAITTPNGIDERSFVRLNGIDQWVTIRGEDRRNPVLLMLAGGPGNTLVPLSAVFRPWEKYFTIVQWDQRGAGRTYEQNGPNGEGVMTLDRFAADGVKLTEFLRYHLHKDRIVILGASFGSSLGVRMAKARPDYFSAYVGTGQVVADKDQEAMDYADALQRARDAHDAESVAALQRSGPPPYKTIDPLVVERNISSLHDTELERGLRSKLTPVVLFAPDVSLLDLYYFLTNTEFSVKAMYRELSAYDVHALGPDFAVPLFVFEGDKDAITPPSLSRAWLAGLHAPKKEFVILPGGGHSAVLSMPEVFLKELVARVRPLAVRN